MQIGYMRISKGEQTTALQEDALAKALVERTYRDVMSGVRDDRSQCASNARLLSSIMTHRKWGK
jgi:DNA invertase Pin-like site-specific DNA recombinase